VGIFTYILSKSFGGAGNRCCHISASFANSHKWMGCFVRQSPWGARGQTFTLSELFKGKGIMLFWYMQHFKQNIFEKFFHFFAKTPLQRSRKPILYCKKIFLKRVFLSISDLVPKQSTSKGIYYCINKLTHETNFLFVFSFFFFLFCFSLPRETDYPFFYLFVLMYLFIHSNSIYSWISCNTHIHTHTHIRIMHIHIAKGIRRTYPQPKEIKPISNENQRN